MLNPSLLQAVHVPFKIACTSSAQMRAHGEAYSGSVGSASAASGPAHKEETLSSAPAMQARTVVVPIESLSANKQHRMPISILNVSVQPLPFAIDQTFRFYGPQREWIQRRIILDPTNKEYGLGWRASPEQARASIGDENGTQQSAKYAWTDDENARVATGTHQGDSSLQEVVVSYRCGDAGSEHAFHVVIYNESSRISVFEIWRITVVAAHGTEVHGLLGTETSCSITLRGKDRVLACKPCSSHFNELSVEVEGRHLLFLLVCAVHGLLEFDSTLL